MKDLKICLLTSEFLPNWGGVGTYCLELAKALADRVDLHVVTVGRAEGRKLEYSKTDIEHQFDDKITVHLLTICSASDTFFYNAKMQIAVSRHLPALIRKHKFDLIHTNIPQMADILLKVKGQLTTPSITTVHTVIEGHKQGIQQASFISGLPFSKLDRSEKMLLLAYPALRFAERMYIKRSKNFIAVSNWMNQILKKDFPAVHKSHVIHNGVDIKKFSPNISQHSQAIGIPKGRFVLVPSRLTALKGITLLINAIPKILSQNDDINFVFAGAGPKKVWINLLDSLRVNRASYRFLGHIQHESMPLLYSKADFTILPSLFEDLPFAILEAMSCGCPVIASNVGGIPEVITNAENGLLFQRGNLDDLINASNMLLSDDSLRNRLSKNARKTITDHFSWSGVAEQTIKVYTEALGN